MVSWPYEAARTAQGSYSPRNDPSQRWSGSGGLHRDRDLGKKRSPLGSECRFDPRQILADACQWRQGPAPLHRRVSRVGANLGGDDEGTLSKVTIRR